MSARYPNGHVVLRARVGFPIYCQGGGGVECLCESLATRCEHRGIGRTVSFFYFCDRHWITADPDGTSPRDRASRVRT